MTTTKEDISAKYATELTELKCNSKPLINSLTMMAEDYIRHAPIVVQTIEAHLKKVKPELKLSVLYLIDSIVKNVKKDYVELFTQNIVSTFTKTFDQVSEKTRSQMWKLRLTWNDVFSTKKLYSIDVKCHQTDPGWPITAHPPSTANIHVNPKFLARALTISPPTTTTQSPVVVSTVSSPSLPSTSTTTANILSGIAVMDPPGDITEARMREQLLIKQKELLELQTKKLELELLHTKAQLEEKTRKQIDLHTHTQQQLETQTKQQQLLQQAEIAKHQTDIATSLLMGNLSATGPSSVSSASTSSVIVPKITTTTPIVPAAVPSYKSYKSSSRSLSPFMDVHDGNTSDYTPPPSISSSLLSVVHTTTISSSPTYTTPSKAVPTTTTMFHPDPRKRRSKENRSHSRSPMMDVHDGNTSDYTPPPSISSSPVVIAAATTTSSPTTKVSSPSNSNSKSIADSRKRRSKESRPRKEEKDSKEKSSSSHSSSGSGSGIKDKDKNERRSSSKDKDKDERSSSKDKEKDNNKRSCSKDNKRFKGKSTISSTSSSSSRRRRDSENSSTTIGPGKSMKEPKEKEGRDNRKRTRDDIKIRKSAVLNRNYRRRTEVSNVEDDEGLMLGSNNKKDKENHSSSSHGGSSHSGKGKLDSRKDGEKSAMVSPERPLTGKGVMNDIDLRFDGLKDVDLRNEASVGSMVVGSASTSGNVDQPPMKKARNSENANLIIDLFGREDVDLRPSSGSSWSQIKATPQVTDGGSTDDHPLPNTGQQGRNNFLRGMNEPTRRAMLHYMRNRESKGGPQMRDDGSMGPMDMQFGSGQFRGRGGRAGRGRGGAPPMMMGRGRGPMFNNPQSMRDDGSMGPMDMPSFAGPFHGRSGASRGRGGPPMMMGPSIRGRGPMFNNRPMLPPMGNNSGDIHRMPYLPPDADSSVPINDAFHPRVLPQFESNPNNPFNILSNIMPFSGDMDSPSDKFCNRNMENTFENDSFMLEGRVNADSIVPINDAFHPRVLPQFESNPNNPFNVLSNIMPFSGDMNSLGDKFRNRNMENVYEGEPFMLEGRVDNRSEQNTSSEPIVGSSLDVQDLLSRLMMAGLLHPSKEEKKQSDIEAEDDKDKAVAETTLEAVGGQDDAQTQGDENMEDVTHEIDQDEFEAETETIPIPPTEFVDVTFDKLKERRDKLIDIICSGVQCGSCGLRFPPDQTVRYSQHLDWHFRQNRREKANVRKAQSRKWYYDLVDWIQFSEIEDLEERALSLFESQEMDIDGEIRSPGTALNPDLYTVPSIGHDGAVCPQCNEGFESFFDEEKEEWRLRDAFLAENSENVEDGTTKLYHPNCHQDYLSCLQGKSMLAKVKETPPMDTTEPSKLPEDEDEVLILKEGKPEVEVMDIAMEEEEELEKRKEVVEGNEVEEIVELEVRKDVAEGNEVEEIVELEEGKDVSEGKEVEEIVEIVERKEVEREEVEVEDLESEDTTSVVLQYEVPFKPIIYESMKFDVPTPRIKTEPLDPDENPENDDILSLDDIIKANMADDGQDGMECIVQPGIPSEVVVPDATKSGPVDIDLTGEDELSNSESNLIAGLAALDGNNFLFETVAVSVLPKPVVVSIDAASLKPRNESSKVRLGSRNLVNCPPKESGKEVSGLCSIC